MELIHNRQTRSLIIVILFLSLIAVRVIFTRAEKNNAQLCEALFSDLKNISQQDMKKGIQGKAYIVKNMTVGEEYISRDTQSVLPLGSLVKLMTVRTAIQQYPVNTDAYYTLTEKDTAPYGSTPGITVGSEFRIKDLAAAALISSSNDAAEALSNSVSNQDSIGFLSSMQKEARSLGLNSFSFSGVTGLDSEENTATAFGSASDVATLLYKNVIDMPEVFVFPQKSQVIESREGIFVTLEPTNVAIPNLPLLVAGKTGYTLIAGGNLAVLWTSPRNPAEYISAVVLGSTISGRFSDIEHLYRATDRYLTNRASLDSICN